MTLDPSIPHWPRCLMPRAVEIGLNAPVLSGPQPLSGRPQTVMSDMGAWRIRLGGVRLTDRSFGIHQFRALFFGRLALGLPVYMPFWDWRRGPQMRAGGFAPVLTTTHDDTAPHSDGGLYQQSGLAIGLAQAAALRATDIIIATADLAALIAGDYISIEERGHMVVAVREDDLDPSLTHLTIVPPLREALAVGAQIEYADPVVRVVLDPADRTNGLALDLLMIGAHDLTFHEANWTA